MPNSPGCLCCGLLQNRESRKHPQGQESHSEPTGPWPQLWQPPPFSVSSQGQSWWVVLGVSGHNVSLWKQGRKGSEMEQLGQEHKGDPFVGSLCFHSHTACPRVHPRPHPCPAPCEIHAVKTSKPSSSSHVTIVSHKCFSAHSCHNTVMLCLGPP